MYSVLVRDHVMIAHSFTGAVFGPAQRLHGATYIVDLEFRRTELDPDGIVVDIGRASEVLRAIDKGDLGPNAYGIESMKVTLHESHIAAASFEGSLRDFRPSTS